MVRNYSNKILNINNYFVLIKNLCVRGLPKLKMVDLKRLVTYGNYFFVCNCYCEFSWTNEIYLTVRNLILEPKRAQGGQF